MDYEKLHKDTIAKLQEMVNSGKITVEIAHGICADFVSESEDEKVRKWIRKELESKYVVDNIVNNEMADKALAWLEKQSTPQVRTGLEWVNTIDDACDKRYLEEYAHGEYCHEQSFKWGFHEGVDWLENQGVQKTVDDLTQQEAMDIAVAKCFEQGEQKPAEWSEEDEEIHRRCICAMRASACGFPEEEKFVEKVDNWLKSLKDKVQPKQEWSEEEEQTFIKSVEALEDFGKFELADWLKEHKNQFLKPQNTWKPSDEQIKAVRLARAFVTDNFDDNPTLSEILIELEKQLKKLREK